MPGLSGLVHRLGEDKVFTLPVPTVREKITKATLASRSRVSAYGDRTHNPPVPCLDCQCCDVSEATAHPLLFFPSLGVSDEKTKRQTSAVMTVMFYFKIKYGSC